MKLEISFNYVDPKGEIDLVFEVKIAKGHGPYFSNSFGNWLPGEEDEVEVLSVCVNGSYAPELLEEEFIKMVGLDKITERALECAA